MDSALVPTKLGLVARRIEGDIRSRGLNPGDRYLTVSEAADFLDVSPATAHRAMDLLVSRQLLVRHHGRGTFVGEGAGELAKARVRTVYILMPEDQEGVTSVQLDVMVDAVRKSLGSVNVHFAFVPSQGSLEYVRELIGTAQQAGQLAGVIPISCSREIYRYLSDQAGPVVVLGSLYPDQRHIASVDVDNRTEGQLLAGHLVGQGHQRMALLATGDGRPGDHAFFDGISDALTAAGLPHNSLTVRMFSRDFEAFRSQVHELLSRADRPTGIICTTERLMAVAVSVAESLGLRIPADLEIVYQGFASSDGERLPFAHVQPKVPFKQVAERIAGMLKQLADNQPLSEMRVVLDVELRVPGKEKH